MAEELSNYEFPASDRKPRYDWDEWLNGKPWRLKKGIDFSNSPKTFRNYVSNVTHMRGLSVRTVIEDDETIVIQAFTKPGK